MQQQDVASNLAYLQLPEKRWLEQMQAAQAAIPAAYGPQMLQHQLNQEAANNTFQRNQIALNTPPWGEIGIPKEARKPGAWQQIGARIPNAIMGGLAGAPLGPWGMAAGAAAGAMGATPPAITMNGPSPIASPAAAPQRQIGIPQAAPGFFNR